MLRFTDDNVIKMLLLLLDVPIFNFYKKNKNKNKNKKLKVKKKCIYELLSSRKLNQINT